MKHWDLRDLRGLRGFRDLRAEAGGDRAWTPLAVARGFRGEHLLPVTAAQLTSMQVPGSRDPDDCGPRGPQGFRGPTGFPGAQGATGAQGAPGAQGSGAQGAVGAQGAQGTQGAPGDIGPQGAGDMGLRAPRVTSGRRAFRVPRVLRVIRAAWDRRVPRASGYSGRPGDIGPQGASVCRVPRVVPGDIGPQGAQGLGCTGCPGSAG